MSIKSPTSLFKSSGLISAQDLLGLMKTAGKSAFLRMKSYSTLVRTVKWKQRFVILANNEIYIYENEMSKRPESCLPLFGYNQIKRYNSEKYPWSFTIIGGVTSLKPRVFSCATDEERRMWMRKIKEHLYKANDIEPSFTDALNPLTSGTSEEYLDLEEPIFLAEDVKEEKEHCNFDGAEISGDERSSEEDDNSWPQDTPFNKDRNRKISTGSGSKDKTLPPIPVSSPPPRYSAVVQDLGKRFHSHRSEEIGEEEVEEQTEHETARSRLERCLITDPALERDRNACRELLQDKSRIGVYLLRKSRSGESLVLVVLTDNTDVKEYRLEEKDDLYRLQCKSGATEFISIDALLSYFSTDAFLPGINHFLTFGIFECPDDTYTDMQ